MRNAKTYEVWVADLDSLYDETPRPPVMYETVQGIETARILKSELSADLAAWIVDPLTNQIVQ